MYQITKKRMIEGRNFLDKEKIYQLITKEIGLEFVKKDEPMWKHTSFKIGGLADIFVTVKKEDALKAILKIAREKNDNRKWNEFISKR